MYVYCRGFPLKIKHLPCAGDNSIVSYIMCCNLEGKSFHKTVSVAHKPAHRNSILFSFYIILLIQRTLQTALESFI